MNQLPSDVETNRNSDKKKKIELDRTHICQEAAATKKKLHWIGILRDIQEEVGQREHGEGQ
jgi:hypothetical protein